MILSVFFIISSKAFFCCCDFWILAVLKMLGLLNSSLHFRLHDKVKHLGAERTNQVHLMLSNRGINRWEETHRSAHTICLSAFSLNFIFVVLPLHASNDSLAETMKMKDILRINSFWWKV